VIRRPSSLPEALGILLVTFQSIELLLLLQEVGLLSNNARSVRMILGTYRSPGAVFSKSHPEHVDAGGGWLIQNFEAFDV
jgi:hypothetical protein